jgi:hypothetical protein
MKELMQALLRIEKKLDELIKLARGGIGTGGLAIIQPIDSEGQVCQLCNQPAVYHKEPISGNMWRSCGCAPKVKES